MFGRILYPTDFSDVSKKALDYLKQLREAGAKEVIVLHIIDTREIESIARYGEVPMNLEKGLEEKMEESVKQELTAVEAELRESGFDVKVRIEKGIPFREILRVEEEEEVSVVVIGSHGKSCVAEMFLGSVSEKVVRKSKRPVLVVRR